MHTEPLHLHLAYESDWAPLRFHIQPITAAYLKNNELFFRVPEIQTCPFKVVDLHPRLSAICVGNLIFLLHPRC